MADDATLIANSRKGAKEIIEILIVAGRRYGLNLNIEKTKIIQVRENKRIKNRRICGRRRSQIFRYKDRRKKNRKKCIPSKKQGMDGKSGIKG